LQRSTVSAVAKFLMTRDKITRANVWGGGMIYERWHGLSVEMNDRARGLQ